MPLVDLQCRHCGAPLPPTRPGESCVCPYCGQSYALDAPAPSAPPAREATTPPRARAPRSATIVFVALTLLPLLLAPILFFSLSGPRGHSGSSIGAAVSHVVHGRFIWDEVGWPPQIARAGDREVAVARFREEGDQLYVEAREAPALSRRWRAGPFGSYEEGYRATWFRVAGDRVAVTEVRAKVHVYDLGTGAELATFPLTDRPSTSGLCASAAGLVLFETADGNRWALDPTGPSLHRTAAEARCAGPRLSLPLTRAPRVPGFRATRLFEGDGAAVALGHREPGTPVPRAVGFAAATGAVLWSSDLAAADPDLAEAPAGVLLSGGRLFATFEQHGAYRLGAFDARDGRRLWEIPVPEGDSAIEPQLAAGQSWLFVGTLWKLLAIDPSTGRIAGSAGT